MFQLVKIKPAIPGAAPHNVLRSNHYKSTLKRLFTWKLAASSVIIGLNLFSLNAQAPQVHSLNTHLFATAKVIASVVKKPTVLNVRVGEKDYNKTSAEARFYLKQGTEAYNTKMYAEAIKLLSAALNLQSNLTAAYEKRALSYFKLDALTLAEKDFTKAIDLDPRNSKLYSYRGSLYMQMQHFYKATLDYSTWITLDTHNPKAYYYRGSAYLKIAEGKKAIADFTDVLFHEPANEIAYYNRGVSKATVGDHLTAIGDFTRAVTLNKFLAQGFLSRAISHAELDNHPAALADIEKALTITPTYTEAYITQAVSLQKLNDLAAAKKALLKALAIDPLSSKAYYHLATVEKLLNNRAGAQNHYQTSLRILSDELFNDPKNPQHFSDRAQIYILFKDYANALADYKAAEALYITMGSQIHRARIQKKITSVTQLSHSTPK
ncbi:hypothetical protein COTS27_00111 [Spirochaetota bacterium]|nr:hypothetical protein COTS27_00111 [Spirochaetota bacterium]